MSNNDNEVEEDSVLVQGLLKRAHDMYFQYSSFFNIYVLPTLRITPVTLLQLKNSDEYIICKKLIELEVKPKEVLSTILNPATGLNKSFITYIISICKFITKKSRDRKKSSNVNVYNFKERLVTLVNLLKGTQIPFDEHNLVIFAWWLPHLTEIITMIVSKKKLTKEKSTVVMNCLDNFLEQSTLVIYFLTGNYMFSKHWKQYIDTDLKKIGTVDNHINELFLELQQMSKQHTQAIRKLLTESNRHSEQSYSDPYQRVKEAKPYYNTIDKMRLEALLEPPFSILYVLARLVFIDNEDSEIGRSVLRFLQGNNCFILFLKIALSYEIIKTTTFDVLFRAESVATKFISVHFFSKEGTRYLNKIVRSVFNSLENNINNEEEENSPNNIISIAESILIKANHVTIPSNFGIIFNYLQQEVAKKFPKMRHKIIGGFFFLRFICPCIVSPENYNINTKFSKNKRKILIKVSKLLQNLANNTFYEESTQGAQLYNQFIKNNVERSQQLFDKLANLNVYQSGFPEDNISPKIIYEDFHKITEFIAAAKVDLLTVTQEHLPNNYIQILQYLYIDSPSIYKEIISNNKNEMSEYSKVVMLVGEIFPPKIVQFLLGYNQSNPSPISFSWYKTQQVRDNKISLIMQSISYFKEETKTLLSNVFRVIQLLEMIYSVWLYEDEATKEIKSAYLRHIFRLVYYFEKLSEVGHCFCIPEIWEGYLSVLNLFEYIIKITFIDCENGFKHSTIVRDSISLVITQLKWTVTRLIELQNITNVIEI